MSPLWDAYDYFVLVLLLAVVLVLLLLFMLFQMVRHLLNPDRQAKASARDETLTKVKATAGNTPAKASDKVARNALIEKIRLQGLPSLAGPHPVVSLEDFFEGNEDYGSIGCNISMHPGPQGFFDHLLTIRSQPGVQDVLVEISEVEESDPSMWPFSECVFVLTSASIEDVVGWMEPLKPDEIQEGYPLGKPPAAPELAQGMQVYAAWWD